MEGQRVAAFGRPRPGRRLTGNGNLLAVEPCLVADDSPGAALTFQAVAHGNARWLALNGKAKLPAVACGASGGHGSLRGCRYPRSVGWISSRRTWVLARQR